MFFAVLTERKILLTHTRTELMPGVHFRAIHTTKFKSAYLSVTFLAPLQQKSAAVNALIPYVLRRGSKSCPDMESVSAALDELYGGAIEPMVRKKGETQCVGFAASFLDDAYTLEGEQILEPAAAMLGELLLNPLTENGHFSAGYVAGEKANLIDRIRSQINDKRSYATLRLKQLMCRDEAFGVDTWGDEEHAAAITEEDLWQQYRWMLSNCEVEVYYCGSAEPERARRAMMDALKNLPRSESFAQTDCEIRLTVESQPRVVEEAMDVTQGKLAMGFRTGGITVWEEEFLALLMLNGVFGGTTLSKLFMNVREKLSLCYYASSTLEKMKGLVCVSSGIEFDKYQQARDEILVQLEAIRSGQVEDWELEGARRTLMTGYMSLLDSQGRQEDFWLGQAVSGLEETPEQLAQRIEQVTLDQVVQAAHKLQLDTIYFLKGKEM